MRCRWLFAASLAVLTGSANLSSALPLSLADGEWTYTDGASLDEATAVLETRGWSSNVPVVSVYRGLEIPSWAILLCFDFRLSVIGPDPEGEGVDLSFPDFFTASYWDAEDGSGSSDRTFVNADANGPYLPFASSIETLGNGWYRATAAIADLAGRSGTLYFDLYDWDDRAITEARITNVEISPVPEPGTLALLGTGLLGLARVARWKWNAGGDVRS